MNANELSKKFLYDWQSKNKNSRIYRNNTGIYFEKYKLKNGKPKTRKIAFGIPLPEGNGKGGGGTDWIAFTGITITPDMVGQKICKADFIEIKTKNDSIKPNQKIWYQVVKSFFGKVFIVKESDNKKGFEINEY